MCGEEVSGVGDGSLGCGCVFQKSPLFCRSLCNCKCFRINPVLLWAVSTAASLGCSPFRFLVLGLL